MTEETRIEKSNEEENGRIVYPGDVLVESMEILPGQKTFREGNKIFSKVIGSVKEKGRVISVTPLCGRYMPQVKDYVIAEITDTGFSNWTTNINSAYEATLSISDIKEYVERGADITKYYDIGDLILAKVSEVTKTKFVNVSMKDPKCRKLHNGIIVSMTSSKVPRLIGKSGSMINMIKDQTKCQISVGQNGWVWLKGEHEDIAIKAINTVDKFAHISGLTEKISNMLDKELGK